MHVLQLAVCSECGVISSRGGLGGGSTTGAELPHKGTVNEGSVWAIKKAILVEIDYR